MSFFNKFDAFNGEIGQAQTNRGTLLTKMLKFENLVLGSTDIDVIRSYVTELQKLDEEFIKYHNHIARSIQIFQKKEVEAQEVVKVENTRSEYDKNDDFERHPNRSATTKLKNVYSASSSELPSSDRDVDDDNDNNSNNNDYSENNIDQRRGSSASNDTCSSNNYSTKPRVLENGDLQNPDDLESDHQLNEPGCHGSPAPKDIYPSPVIEIDVSEENFDPFVERNILKLFKKYPKMHLYQLTEEYKATYGSPLKCPRGLDNLPDLLKKMEGLNLSDDRNVIIDTEVQCYPYKIAGICECGLFCDGLPRPVSSANYRIIQCKDEPTQNGCTKGNQCEFLHTRTPYELTEPLFFKQEEGQCDSDEHKRDQSRIKHNSGYSRAKFAGRGPSILRSYSHQGLPHPSSRYESDIKSQRTSPKLLNRDVAQLSDSMKERLISVFRHSPFIYATQFPQVFRRLFGVFPQPQDFGYSKLADMIKALGPVEIFTDKNRLAFQCTDALVRKHENHHQFRDGFLNRNGSGKGANGSTEHRLSHNNLPPRNLRPAMEAKLYSVMRYAPLVLASQFPNLYRQITEEKFNVEEFGSENTIDLMKSLPGVQVYLEKNHVLYQFSQISCFPYKKCGRCECGLNCDFTSPSVSLDYRIRQCKHELTLKGCPHGSDCGWLHTQSMYIDVTFTKPICSFNNNAIGGCRRSTECPFRHICSKCNLRGHGVNQCSQNGKFFKNGSGRY